MAIPKVALEIKPIDWDNLSLVQYAVLAGRTDDLMDIREFLLDNSNWRRQDVNRISISELAQIIGMVQAEVEKQISPKVPSPNSSVGQEESPTPLPTGS